MALNWKKTEGSVCPQRVDTEMSKKFVYVRANPKKSGNVWKYDEAVVGKEEYEQNAESIEHEIVEKENSIDVIIALIAESVEIDDRLPKASKEGYVLARRYIKEENRIIWDYVPDPDYHPSTDGTYLRPYQYVSGMTVESGKWYYLDDVELPNEAMKSGVPSGFDDEEYFVAI